MTAVQVLLLAPSVCKLSSVTPMQQLITDRLAHHGLSYRAAAMRTGGLITHATIHQIATGRSVGPWPDKTLRGLSLALDVPYRRVEEASKAAHPERSVFVLPKKAELLDTKERAVILALIDALLSHRADHKH